MLLLLHIFEIMGIMAASVSGALVGIVRGMDIFGVVFLAVTTSVGGGIIRDLLLGSTPPQAFLNPVFCLVAIITALIAVNFSKRIVRLKYVIVFFDALGLGVFTGLGSEAAVSNGFTDPFIVISMGLATGIGGGILRDILAQQIPFVFRKEVYAITCIMGSTAFYFFRPVFSMTIALYICFLVTFITRILCVKYKISIPPLRKKMSKTME